MNKRNRLIIGIVAFALIAVAVYAYYITPLKTLRANVSPEAATAKEAVCEVLVTNPRGLPLVKNGDLVIESIQCKSQYVSSCARFGIFSDAGTLRLDGDGGIGSAEDLKISEGSTEGFSLGWCGSKITNTLKAKLYDGNNNLLQSKDVRIS